MNTISCSLTTAQIEKLRQTFSDSLVAKTPPYALYQLKPENCTITAYTSGKVVFQGKDAQIYAAAFVDAPQKNQDQAGSDEVGTGDYFGPVCVCACLVKASDEAWLSALKVKDSKQLKDCDMLKLGPILMEKLDHSLLILENARYNRIHSTNNLNQIKARLHNQAYLNLINKGCVLPALTVIDQFTPEASYYRYLKQEKQIVRGIHFETKAENKYLAVACASIIARYGFLKAWQSIETHYGMILTKGAGAKVDQDAVNFVKKFGFDELNCIAKLHFKNTENVKALLNIKKEH